MHPRWLGVGPAPLHAFRRDSPPLALSFSFGAVPQIRWLNPGRMSPLGPFSKAHRISAPTALFFSSRTLTRGMVVAVDDELGNLRGSHCQGCIAGCAPFPWAYVTMLSVPKDIPAFLASSPVPRPFQSGVNHIPRRVAFSTLAHSAFVLAC